MGGKNYSGHENYPKFGREDNGIVAVSMTVDLGPDALLILP